MSRNPYLAASRPASSFTRSSRTSKRNDLTSSKGSLSMARSRSSTSLGSGLASLSAYSSGAGGYVPSSSTWQRPSSSSRLTRLADRDEPKLVSTTGSSYAPAEERATSAIDDPSPSLLCQDSTLTPDSGNARHESTSRAQSCPNAEQSVLFLSNSLELPLGHPILVC